MTTNNSTERTTSRADTHREQDVFWRQLRDNIQELLRARGMTQKQLAAASGIPYSTLNKKMRGVHRVWWLTDFADLYATFDGDPVLFRGLGRAV
ncbi:helix-turn-helix domain-containing protein [Microbacterium sp. E-13]|uniref:helix-turn-helix domain-containing protein n=1 Tax=Microbacterium sp. E-13 TaxID=3404048 RepID=UPI003CF8FB21